MAAASTKAAAKFRLPPIMSMRDILHIYQIRAWKKLSQNFLLNQEICRKIVRAAGDITGTYVSEVGPGPGGITRAILEQDVKRLLVIEKDRRFLPSLEMLAEASQNRMTIEQADVLRYDYTEKFPDEVRRDWFADPPPLHLIGNLPFNVATPLIILWLEAICDRTGPFSYGRTQMTLTFQREVAERMVAPILHKQRCRLSLTVQNLTDVRHVFTIAGGSFSPAPKVDVGVVHFVPLEVPRIPLAFPVVQKVLRHLFHFRQKYCISGLETLFPQDMEKTLAHEMLRQSRISPKVPCTKLSIEEVRDLCFAYEDICRRIPGLYHFYYREPQPLESLAKLKDPFPPVYKFKRQLEGRL